VRESLREPGHGIEEVVLVAFSSRMLAIYQRFLETE